MPKAYEGTRVRTDFLVIGSGIAGLAFALKAAEHGRVTVISKAAVEETNTRYAQGGIAAAVHSADSAEKHVQDTLRAGAGLCNEATVRMVVAEAPRAIRDLVEWGARFDRKPDGSYDLAREGGHSEHRVLHYRDSTGLEIQEALTARARSHPNIRLMEHHFAIDLLTQHQLGREVRHTDTDIECYGAYALDLRTLVIRTILSRVTLLATGGTGN
ncbi:MAG: FAD-dependent oxidoreductase, partial [Acidobacteria bacterium]|nr:FAD-dependent oxidoreductase [Acidobacteriota bacterium]